MTQHNHHRAAAPSALALLALLAILSACSSESELRFTDSFIQDHDFTVELNSDGDGLDISFNPQSDASYQLTRTSESGCSADTCADYLAFTINDEGTATDSLPEHVYYYKLTASLHSVSEEFSTKYSTPITLPDDFTATAGNGQVTLSWTPYSDDTTYNIYRSSDPNCDLDNYSVACSATEGELFSGTVPDFVDVGLTNYTTYHYWIEAAFDGVSERAANPISSTPHIIASNPLNDTGIDWGGDYPSGNNSDCSSNVSAPQDCDQGRDATDNDDSDGHAGFSFTKIDSSGNTLDASATEWSCVLDNVTGLIWEVKTDDGGLRDKDDSYNWYNTDPETNGGAVGSADYDGDVCYGYDSSDASTYCNTEAFAARVNAVGLCGAKDWRMPTRLELRSIVDLSRTNPSIDTNYFPNARSELYWSASPYANDSDFAWLLYFYYGDDYIYGRVNSDHVRLVRSGQ